MYISSPREVLAEVSRDLKARHLTQEKVAEMTGYKSRQSISFILKSDNYMNAVQAKAFHDAFGYYEGFLLAGEGSLMSDQPDPEKVAAQERAVYPEAVLKLRPFEDRDSFKKAFDRLLDKAILLYGEENVRKLMLLCVHYFDFYSDFSENDIKCAINRRIRRGMPREEADKLREYYHSEDYKEFSDRQLDGTMDSLYSLYMELSERCL